MPEPSRSTRALGDLLHLRRYTLLAVVAVAAAWMSFSALTGLARMAHIWPPQLLPVAIDAYAVAATRLWLTSAPGTRTRRWAMVNSLGAIAISIAGNSAYHGYAEAGVSHLSWQLAAAVAAVAPATLWLVVHMHSLLSAGTPDTARGSAADQAVPAPGPVVGGPVRAAAPPKPTTRRVKPTASRIEQVRARAREELAAGRDISAGALARETGADPSQVRRAVREVKAESNGHALAGTPA